MSRRDELPDDDHDDDDEFSDPDEDGPSPLGRGGPRDAGGDDDFDEFEDSIAGGVDPSPGGRGQTMVVKNKEYDEAMELSESEGESPQASPMGGYPNASAGGAGRGNSSSRPRSDATIKNREYDEEMELSSEASVDGDDDDGDDRGGSPGGGDGDGMDDPTSMRQRQMESSMGMGGGARGAVSSPEASPEPVVERQRRPERPTLGSMPAPAPQQDDDDDDDNYGGGDDGEGAGAPVPEGLYDPAEYADLPVSAEIKELFQHITRYKAHNIELETKMRSFIPDYIPAVGDIDPFIKIPRPDGKSDNLGLVTLDEPASVQSDATVLTLQLRAVTKSSGAQPMLVRSVDHAEKDPKAITSWISSIADLHRHKPAPSVRYTKPMPDIEQLMQIWPAPVEELLDQNPLPDADISLDLASYVRMVCAMLDVPVYGDSVKESLHVVFTLYSDFKANVHFQQQMQQQEGGMGMPGPPGEGLPMPPPIGGMMG